VIQDNATFGAQISPTLQAVGIPPQVFVMGTLIFLGGVLQRHRPAARPHRRRLTRHGGAARDQRGRSGRMRVSDYR